MCNVTDATSLAPHQALELEPEAAAGGARGGWLFHLRDFAHKAVQRRHVRVLARGKRERHAVVDRLQHFLALRHHEIHALAQRLLHVRALEARG